MNFEYVDTTSTPQFVDDYDILDWGLVENHIKTHLKNKMTPGKVVRFYTNKDPDHRRPMYVPAKDCRYASEDEVKAVLQKRETSEGMDEQVAESGIEPSFPGTESENTEQGKLEGGDSDTAHTSKPFIFVPVGAMAFKDGLGPWEGYGARLLTNIRKSVWIHDYELMNLEEIDDDKAKSNLMSRMRDGQVIKFYGGRDFDHKYPYYVRLKDCRYASERETIELIKRESKKQKGDEQARLEWEDSAAERKERERLEEEHNRREKSHFVAPTEIKRTPSSFQEDTPDSYDEYQEELRNVKHEQIGNESWLKNHIVELTAKLQSIRKQRKDLLSRPSSSNDQKIVRLDTWIKRITKALELTTKRLEGVIARKGWYDKAKEEGSLPEPRLPEGPLA